MMTKFLRIALLGLLGIAACQKADYPYDYAENPVFHVEYTIDGQTVADTAGREGVYQFTSAVRDSKGILNLSGIFAQANCAVGCPGTFSIVLRSPVISDSTFVNGAYPYFWNDNPDSVSYTLGLLPQDLDTNLFSYHWLLDGASPVNGPSADYTRNTPALVPVQLECAHRQDSFRSIVSRSLAFGPLSNPCPYVNIRTLPQGDTMTVLAEVFPIGQYNYTWNTGYTAPTLYGQSFAASGYAVTVTDPASSCSATAELAGVSNWSSPLRTTNILLVNDVIIVPDLENSVILEWIDPQRVSWRSDRLPQPSDAFFRILDNVPYDRNEYNLPTRKLNVEFHCQLFNADGVGKDLMGSGVVGVGWQ